MDNVCKWNYKKYSYIITIRRQNKPDEYILFGKKYKSMTKLKLDNYIHSSYDIEEDDNINQILIKISYELKLEPEKIHIYAENVNTNNDKINLKYDYFLSSGRPIVIEEIKIVPNFFDYNLKKINKLSKDNYKPYTDNYINILNTTQILNKNNLENNLINSYNLNRTIDEEKNEYYENIIIILYEDAIREIKHSKLNTYDIKQQFENIYYPDLTKDLKKNISFINYKDIKIDLDKDKNQIEKLYALLNSENKYKIKSSECTIVEVIIHVNYNTYSADFVDQVKIFHSMRLNNQIPFVKFKGDSTMYPQFRLIKNLTNPQSEIYIPEEELYNWTFKSKNKMNKEDDSLILTGKGLSYKIFLYKIENKQTGKFTNKYLTLNIYRGGKLDIKCNWSDNISGNLNNVISAVEKVRDFIREINKIDFQLISSPERNKLIEEPDLDFLTNRFSNTKIAFYNINYEIETHTKISTNLFEEYIKKYDTFVNFIEKNKGDIDSTIELRYKRINGFLKMDKINNYIYKLYKADLSRDEIIHLLEVQYNVSKDTAKMYYNKYITMISKKPISKMIVDEIETEEFKTNRLILNEQIKGKNPGTEIKLYYKNNNKYKVSILGTPQNSAGQIYYFINSVIEKFLNKNQNKDKKNAIIKNKFGNKLINIDFDDDYDEDSYEISASSDNFISSNGINDTTGTIGGILKNENNINKINENDIEFKPEPTGENLLNRLKSSNITLFYYDKYKNNSYSRKCQDDIKKPLVISSRKAFDLLEKQKKLLIEAHNEKNKAKIKQINENIALLESKGRHIKGYFYFCPSQWDGDNYEPVSDKTTNKIIKNDFTKIGFSNEVCQPCCMKEHSVRKHVRLDNFCMNKFTNNSTEEYSDILKNNKNEIKQHKAYRLEASKLFYDVGGRYINLPTELNKIFNQNKVCTSTNKDVDKNITCYLRKTVEKGNYFLNAVSEIINGKPITLFNTIRALLSNNQKAIEKLIKLYRSLKKGSIYNIFLDDAYLVADTNSVELLFNSFTNFLQYIYSNLDTINETFLWDILSHKDIVLKNTGLNIFIIEGFLIGQNILSEIKIKCPVGYDLETLYDINRPSLVLFKYINNYDKQATYEIICEATYTIKKISSKILFEPNNPIIINFIKTLKKCEQINDINASDEFKKYIDNVSHSTIIDRLYDLEISALTITVVEKAIEKMIADYPNEFDDYRIKAQLIDRYNKVRYLLLENNFLMPINPSTVSLKYNIIYTKTQYKLSYYETMEKILILEKYALIKRITPFSFLIDPGKNLTDPTDDIVVAILLRNGTYINITPILVSEAVETKIEIKKPANLIPIKFDSSKLLFKENMVVDDIIIKKKDIYAQYVFNDEFIIDRELLFNKNIKDNRIKFTVRLTYEEETYNRLRFELSKYLQTPDGLKKKAKIEQILKENLENIDNQRKLIYKILYKIIKKIIIVSNDIDDKEYFDFLENEIGPLNVGFSENMDNENKYKYNYIKPIIKNVCNLEKSNSVHCYNNRLFISSVNLHTGNTNNLDNYINRINEEILRNQLKRTEILNDQIENSITNIPFIENEWYIDTEDLYNRNRNIKDIFDKLYSKNMTIEDKNNEHYDIKNPTNYGLLNNIIVNTTDTSNTCKGEYIQLPQFWINKLKDIKYKIYKTNHNSCIFTLIKLAKESLYNNESINDLKISIIALLSENKNIYKKKGDKKDLWELTKIAYSERYFKTAYYNLFDVDTPNDFFEAIKNNDREITDIDLSLISYIIGVKFIILCDPDGKRNKTGIECLGTTQTNAEYYILLYKNMFNEYHIIYDNSFIKDKSIFRRDEIDDTIIYESWKVQCGKTDDNQFINKLNYLFKPNRYIHNYEEKEHEIVIKEEPSKSEFESTGQLSDSNDQLHDYDS